MSVLFTDECEENLGFPLEKTAEETVNAALSVEGFTVPAEVSVTLTTAEEVHELNRQYRDVDATTDVLSFPLLELEAGENYESHDFSEDIDPDTGKVPLGDIVLNISRVKSQAKEYGHSVKREYSFLICHSMLHLLGYDHMEAGEREIMEEEQRKIMNTLGISREN
ncbi:MAG: rRNA maturation RNase YbeY [Lachnospiraceae bacterium]|nr:rRNA maturation RNase YbeY [Lachnospiraceae bacterium]